MFRYADKHHDLDELRQDLAAIEPLGECKWEPIDEFITAALAETKKWYIDDRARPDVLWEYEGEGT